MVVEELTNPVEEYQEVGVREGVPMCISRPLHCLVQPDTYVWYMWVRRREGGRRILIFGEDVYLCDVL